MEINRKVLASVFIISMLAFSLGYGTMSLFSDTETSSGNTFTAGTLNLKVGDNDPTTWNFAISNLKPGDSGSESVTVTNTGTLDGKLSITFSNLVDAENVVYEPELPDTDADGELAEVLHLVITIDGTTIYDGMASGITGASLPDYSLGHGVSKTFTVAYGIDSAVGNNIQSDIAGFDITFSLAQA